MGGPERVERALGTLLRALESVGLRESTLQDILASELNARARVTDALEADVLADDFCIEVKVGARPYDGFLQAALVKRLLGLKDAYVVHLVSRIQEEHLNLMRECAAITGIPCFVVDVSSRRVMRIP